MFFIKSSISPTSSRTKALSRNVAFIAFLRGGKILSNFLLVPMTINYVTPSVYGIWLTLYSIISWFNIFDIGLGNGLRNNLTQCFVNKDMRSAKEYISTTYSVLICISLIMLLIILVFDILLDWNLILKIPVDFSENVKVIIALLGFGFCFRFIIQIISTIFFSIQKAYITESMTFLGNLFVLIVVFFFKEFFDNRLQFLVVSLCYLPVLIMFFYSISFFYFTRYKFLCPSLQYFKKEKIKSLMNLGVKFFLLQISSLVTYSLSNFLILYYLTPSDVTNYNISYKYFSIITILNNIVCLPLWSAFTEAYFKKDFIWIKNVIRKLVLVFFIWVLLGLVLLIFSDKFYYFWTGIELGIPYSLSLLMYLFTMVCCWNGIFISFINGVGKIYLQVVLSIMPLLLMLPLCYLLVYYFKTGVTGVVFCMLFFNLLSSITISIQTYKILNGRDVGVWAK